MIVDPETGEVFEALDYPQLTRQARGLLRTELKYAYENRYASWWIPGMNAIDRRQLTEEMAGKLKWAAIENPEVMGEIDDEAVYEEIEYFLPKLFLKNKLSGYRRKSPGSIYFNPYTHKIMSRWRYDSYIAKLRHLQEYESERGRIELSRERRSRLAAISSGRPGSERPDKD